MKKHIKRALVALSVPSILALSACGGFAVAQPEATPSIPASQSATSSPETYAEGYKVGVADANDTTVKRAVHPQSAHSDEWNVGYLNGWNDTVPDEPSADPVETPSECKCSRWRWRGRSRARRISERCATTSR